MSDLSTSLDAALAELAVDPIGVLRASGVRGRPINCKECTVARFLTERVGRAVEVGQQFASIPSHGNYFARLPLNVRATIREIDAGMHPELCT
jgi:hypothetical protein